jgi:hypothetical protein
MVKMTGPIKFRNGYKYQLAENFAVQTTLINQSCRILDSNGAEILALRNNGELQISAGYAWDGASGPTLDAQAYRGSLVHDALYQLMRAGKLPQGTRKYADALMMEICKQDGMPWWRRGYWHFALRKFAGYAAERKAEKVYTAP